jgi:Na+(H+)/acetate symporter ActP
VRSTCSRSSWASAQRRSWAEDDQHPPRQVQRGRSGARVLPARSRDRGHLFLAIIAGVAFATILAVVAGLAITASASFAHDIYNAVIKDGKADPDVRR